MSTIVDIRRLKVKRLFIGGAEVRKYPLCARVVCQNCTITPTPLLATLFTVLFTVSFGDWREGHNVALK